MSGRDLAKYCFETTEGSRRGAPEAGGAAADARQRTGEVAPEEANVRATPADLPSAQGSWSADISADLFLPPKGRFSTPAQESDT